MLYLSTLLLAAGKPAPQYIGLAEGVSVFRRDHTLALCTMYISTVLYNTLLGINK